jgi:hypothetical protein
MVIGGVGPGVGTTPPGPGSAGVGTVFVPAVPVDPGLPAVGALPPPPAGGDVGTPVVVVPACG